MLIIKIHYLLKLAIMMAISGDSGAIEKSFPKSKQVIPLHSDHAKLLVVKWNC
jgi:hypothetical protein